MPVGKKTILVDFDGVMNSYKSGWTGDPCKLPDPPTPNAISWLEFMCMDGRFDMCIYSSRSKEPGAIAAMKQWLVHYALLPALLEDDILRFPIEKPAAFMTIDDRVFLFCGTFPEPDEVDAFKPWTKDGGRPTKPSSRDALIAGALFDFVGFLTTREEPLTTGSSHDATAALDRLKEWAATRALNLDKAHVKDWSER